MAFRIQIVSEKAKYVQKPSKKGGYSSPSDQLDEFEQIPFERILIDKNSFEQILTGSKSGWTGLFETLQWNSWTAKMSQFVETYQLCR